MKVAILRSKRGDDDREAKENYLQELDTLYAERVIGNLRDEPGFCSACGPDCNDCRKPYQRRFAGEIAAVLDFPAVLPYVLEKPWQYLPREIPRHDVLLVLSIHEQILLEAVRRCRQWGTRGIVVPLEASDWVCGATRARAYEICEAEGIEIAFPKPFCAFRPPRGSVLSDFREHFHIGFPEVELTIEQGRITATEVVVSAACGATYCVARWLVGRKMSENVEIEVISKRWHAFPCTASMERDPELGDETPLHVAGQAHYAILSSHKERVAGLENPLVTSPLGKLIQKPVAPKENLRNIEKARMLILGELDKRDSLSLGQIRKAPGISPAAINSALLILKKEGTIRSQKGNILLSRTS